MAYLASFKQILCTCFCSPTITNSFYVGFVFNPLGFSQVASQTSLIPNSVTLFQSWCKQACVQLMRWWADVLPKQCPLWVGFNSSVYAAVGQAVLLMETTQEPQLILEHPGLFKFPVCISALSTAGQQWMELIAENNRYNEMPPHWTRSTSFCVCLQEKSL